MRAKSSVEERVRARNRRGQVDLTARSYWLEHSWLAESLVQALIDAERVPLLPVLPTPNDFHGRRLRSEFLAAELAHEDAMVKLAVVEANLAKAAMTPDTDITGINNVRNTLASDVAVQQTKLDSARAMLTQHTEAQRLAKAGLVIQTALTVAETLPDPTDATYRHVWKAAVAELDVSGETVTRYGVPGCLVRWQGKLLITDEHSSGLASLTGERLLGPVSYVEQYLDELEKRLRAGIPVRDCPDGYGKVLVAELARRLGMVTKRRAFLFCDEPTLLRLGMRVLFPQPGDEVPDAGRTTSWAHLNDEQELVAAFAHPDVLAARLHNVYGRHLAAPPDKWRSRVGEWEVDALVQARHGGLLKRSVVGQDAWTAIRQSRSVNGSEAVLWEYDRGEALRLLPCPWCGGSRLARMRISAPDGYVCLRPDCRRDRSGVRWDGRFDVYVAFPSKWAEAGVTLKAERDVSFALLEPRRKRSGKRAVASLTEAELVEVRAAYEAGGSRRVVAARFRLTENETHTLLVGWGILRKRGRRKLS